MKTYKKLFDICYNTKNFSIFINEKNRRTFLEINEEGQYVYPTLEDFQFLNHLYNNFNPFLVNASKYTFQEKVRRGIYGILATIVITSSSSCACKNYIPKLSDTELLLQEENGFPTEKELIEITDLSQLDEILGYKSVSIEEIHSAIDNNVNIENSYKRKIHLFLNNLTIKYPNLDLRIFYENIKTIKMRPIDSTQFSEEMGKNINGQYNANLNQIIYPENITDELFYHELSHTADLFYRENDTTIIYRAPLTKGFALNEAMTNVTASCISAQISYDKYGAILEYLSGYVDFDYNAYNQKGIGYLIELLKEKYPNVDIDYIICTLDSMNITEKNGNYITFDNTSELLNELFEICKTELNNETENFYAPFTRFTKILFYTDDLHTKEPTIMYDYLDKYNKLLMQKRCNIKLITMEDLIKKCAPFQNVEGIAYKKGEIFPLIETYEKSIGTETKYYMKVINQNGNNEEIETFGYNTIYGINLNYYIKLTSLENYDSIGTEEYWKKMALEQNLLSPGVYKEIPIYLNGVLLTNNFLNDLTIKVGLNQEKELGYIIEDKNGSIIYASDLILTNTSNPISLKIYLQNFNLKGLDYIELSTILNEYYLMEFCETHNDFYNIMLKDGQLVVMPNYQLIVNNQHYDLGACYFTIENDNLIIYPFQYSTGFNGNVYLKNVLDYYNILNENQLEYEFTYENLIKLYYDYTNDLSLNTSHSK